MHFRLRQIFPTHEIELEDEMTDSQPRVRQNYWAIVVAAVACFLFEAGWYTLFLQAWLDGIGRSMNWLMSCGMNPALQYGTALVSAVVIATTISCVTQLTGPQTALRGIRVAVLLWFGLVLTTWATEYIFEVRTLKIFAINAGFWLLGMILMGAIVGAWKKK
jgi:Protein of unknown function (DUF1761)